jgi:aminopeptidase N
LHAAGEYDTETRRYTLELAQSTPPTPGQLHKQPLPIPVSLALFDDEGRLLPLRLTDEATASGNERVVELTGATQRFVFEDVPARPIVSLLRGFSAPVLLEDDAGDADLALLLRHEPDGFNRWQAGQRLARRAFAEHLDGGDKRSSTTTWCDALAATLENAGDEGDPARLAELLAPPSETELGEEREQLDPQAIHDTREALLHLLLARLDATVVADRYRQLHAEETGALDAPTRARRHLKNRLLGLLCRGARDVALPLAAAQFDAACCMTDRIAALTLLLHFRADQTDARVAAFRQRHAGDRLALDKCLVAQATIPGEPALGIVEALSSSDDFTLRNPNRVQSLLGAFAHGNPSGFHRVDGAAYVFIAGQLAELDAINPTSAARLANAFNGWTRLEPVRRRQAHAALQSLAARSGNSRGLAEMLGRLMQGAAETAST